MQEENTFRFDDFLLRKAEKNFESKNYETASSYYNSYFTIMFDYNITTIYEESNLDLSQEILKYSISFYNYLTSCSSITKLDCDEFESIEEILKRIEDKCSNNQFIEETKEKFKDIRKVLVELGDEKAKNVAENVRIHSTTRPKEAPYIIQFNGYIYKFAYVRRSDIEYVCTNGTNRHKGKSLCNAAISIPFPIINEKDVQINIVNSVHTCTKEEGIVDRIISDSQIKTWVEEMYLSVTPRPTRKQITTMIYNKISEETKKGRERPIISEVLINNFYTSLEKQYKKVDHDFEKMLKTKRGTIFERFKHRFANKQDGQNDLIICYCSDFQKNRISESKYIFIDGTFDTAPAGFEQVLVILGQTQHMNVPISYILLPNKTCYTYTKALTLFKLETQAYFSNGTIFVTDFELAEINAVKNCFINESHHLQLCYFHYVQSMLRHFQKYERNLITDGLIIIAKLLPFISRNLVYSVIDELLKHQATKKFAEYFDSEYLVKYDFKDWSIYTKPQKNTITNNVAESHNRVLKDSIGLRPSLQKFEIAIREIENDFYNKYELHQISEPEIKRADEESFLRSYRRFLSDLRRYEQSQKMDNQSDFDQYFAETSFIENVPEDISDDDIQIEEEKSIESHSHEENSISTRPIQVQNPCTVDQRKVNIRKLPDKAKKILSDKAKEYNNTRARSSARKRILEESLEEIQKIEPNIEINQIRSWFSNNKPKV